MIPGEITIRVDPALASTYRAASEEDRSKIDLLLNLRLVVAMQSRGSLAELIQSISTRARERGLSENILKSLLNGACSRFIPSTTFRF